MRLFEMGTKKPTRAGLAELKYFDGQDFPTRVEDVITIPDDCLSDLIALRTNKDKYYNFLLFRKEKCWFGGTDELPFLVRLVDTLDWKFPVTGWSTYGFHKSLVPNHIIELSKITKTYYKRQGDIFMLPVGCTLEDLGKAYGLIKGLDLPGIETHKIFGTRHTFQGRLKNEMSILGGSYTVALEGQLRAPDHKPVDITKPCILGQTQYLYDPPKAD